MADELDALIAALPDGRVIADPDIVESYRRDQTAVVAPGKPLCVVAARTTAEVTETMRWASDCGCRPWDPCLSESSASSATYGTGVWPATIDRGCAIRSIPPLRRCQPRSCVCSPRSCLSPFEREYRR